MRAREVVDEPAARDQIGGSGGPLCRASRRRCSPRPPPKCTAAEPALSRIRPGDPAWPSKASWDQLNRDVGDRLIEVRWPLRTRQDDPVGMDCSDLFAELKNRYYVGD
jgi:hypothetical protein